MPVYATPRFSRADIDEAGRCLVTANVSLAQRAAALAIAHNWRSSHNFPLNTFTVRLRERASKAADGVIVAQRIKRLPSIEAKLRRFPQFPLSTIQDLGGSRAICRTLDGAQRLVRLMVAGRVLHELVDNDDYVAAPKRSGYRGWHLIYVYRSNSDRHSIYSGLKIEIQIRSAMQHAWATAVETVDTFLGEGLKSGGGDPRWRRFVALMSSFIALGEKSPSVPNTPPTRAQLCREIFDLERELDVRAKLKQYGDVMQTFNEGELGGAVYVLARYPKMTVTTGYDDFEKAEKSLVTLEESGAVDAVLVKVESLTALKKAYPNYFSDTTRFLHHITRAVTDVYLNAARKALDLPTE